MTEALQQKLEKIVELVNNTMVDPDIDLEYCIPDVETTTNSCDLGGDPYILVNYSENKYVTRKIKLTQKYLEQTPEEIANLVTFSIEQFKEELDSVNMG
jgi:hypothetical protein